MITFLTELTQLSAGDLAFCFAATFGAGLVRGFSGFALSAMMMALVVVILPPVQLIPICFLLEAIAGFAMLRGGMKEADMRVVWGLVIGSAIGVPIGLLATINFPVETSKVVALCVILALTVAQLLKFKAEFLETKPGLYASGLMAGIVTGLASVGGMVVALYVLSQNAAAKSMRGSLVMFLFLGTFTSVFYLLGYGLLNQLAVYRGLVLAPVLLVGIFIGAQFFRPSLAGVYKQFCLGLLVFLSLVGLARLIF